MISNIKKDFLKSMLVIFIITLFILIFSSVFLNQKSEAIYNLVYTNDLDFEYSPPHITKANILYLKNHPMSYSLKPSVESEDLNSSNSSTDSRNKENSIIVTRHNRQSNLAKAQEISSSTPLDLDTAKIIVDYSNRLDLPISIVLALIDLESNFKQYEVGGANDRGYCQIIPGTEKWLANTHGHKLGLEYNPENIFEPEYNIGLGMLYLHILKKAYGEDYHKILSEYNRGIYNLKKYFDKHGTYVTSYSRGVLSREEKYRTIDSSLANKFN